LRSSTIMITQRPDLRFFCVYGRRHNLLGALTRLPRRTAFAYCLRAVN